MVIFPWSYLDVCVFQSALQDNYFATALTSDCDLKKPAVVLSIPMSVLQPNAQVSLCQLGICNQSSMGSCGSIFEILCRCSSNITSAKRQ